MENRYLFFIDAETDGLYGSFLTVAIIVTDRRCNEIERRYWGISEDSMVITDPWVKENVIGKFGDYEVCEDEYDLLEKVWTVWKKYRDKAYVVTDVMHPVESRLFTECARNDLENRKFEGPFPILDLSSILYAKGYNPIADYSDILEEYDKNIQHNAMDDVETIIKVYRKVML